MNSAANTDENKCSLQPEEDSCSLEATLIKDIGTAVPNMFTSNPELFKTTAMGINLNNHTVSNMSKNTSMSKSNMSKNTSIALCMIVKDEAHIIERCLNSMLPLVDFILIVDTGSSDNTIELCHKFFKDNCVEGTVLQHPWKDFSYNRSHAIRCIHEYKDRYDYVFMPDCDNIVQYSDSIKEKLRALTKDVYALSMISGCVSYTLPLIFANKLCLQYKGVLHEFLDIPDTCSRDEITELTVVQIQDSARNKDENKYQKDASVLLKALNDELGKEVLDGFLISRYTFYLAQSHRDFGDLENALAAYAARANQGYWNEEVYIALYQVAHLKEQLNYASDEIVSSYLNAYEYLPTRVEAIYRLGKYLNSQRRYRLAFIILKHAVTIKHPKIGLFVETWLYQYGALDELSISAWWVGDYNLGIKLCGDLLTVSPKSEHARIRANMKMYEESMSKS